MAGLELDGSNPDVSLLYDINGLAKAAPTWFDRVMEFVGEYGTMFGLVLVGLWCWWSMRKRGTAEDSVTTVAALVWAPLAAALAVVINIPIRGFVERPRPFNDHEGLEVLIQGKTDYSFVSDHSTLAMGLAVGIFVANRKFGFVALGLAFFAGVSRIYMGVHYPTDVIGGFALGTAVALLLAPPAMALLTPLMATISRSDRVSWIVRSKKADAGAAYVDERADARGIPEPRPGAGRRHPGEKDLAA
ncbi:phosphatase PAP2 family protein [Streptomyces sp. NPDC057552]|uniref:phosphatase PAP2 family protein n=1 Tax=Streptomyces sp. NPDC057552 TaxID=3350537 RepID=UPI0036946FBD